MTNETRARLALALASAGWLLFQIALVRVLSVVVWYHYAFLAVSLAMLGAAAPGVWFALRPGWRRPGPLLLAAGALPALAAAALVRFGAAGLDMAPVLVTLAAAPPMIAFGAAVVVYLDRAPAASVAPLYAADLAGAGLAAAAATPLLSLVPTPQLLALTGLLPLAGAWVAGARVGAGVLAGLLVAAAAVPGPWTVVRSKVYDEAVSPPLAEVWTPTARIAVFGGDFFHLEGHERGFTWGRGKYYEAPADTVHQLWLEQDGSAGSPITAFDGDPASVEHLLYDVSSLGFQLRRPGTVCVIGAGGGRDVLAALAAGADTVWAVDLVGATLDLVRDTFGEFSGGLYDRDDVIPVAAEGRAFLAGSDRRYDGIQIAMTDSWAATGAGAYALGENGLYTVEAFDLYLDRLTPDGWVALSRWRKELPWLLGLARAALERRGVEQPADHLALQRAGQLATLVVSRRPLDDADRSRLFDVALDRGFYPLYPVPARRKPLDQRVVRWAESGPGELAATGARLAPATDDRPFFFQPLDPFGDPGAQWAALHEATGESVVLEPTRALRQALTATGGLALVLLLVPGAWLVRRGSAGPVRLARGAVYFAGIGFGFVVVETVLLQSLSLLLGHPARAVTVVLAGLLLGMGAGSWLSAHFGPGALSRWGWTAPALVAAAAVVLPATGGALGLPLVVRVMAAAAGSAALGLGLGAWFPLGVRRFGEASTAWWWAVNGSCGAVGAVLAVALAMRFGFAATLGVAAAAYALAWLAGSGRAARPRA